MTDRETIRELLTAMKAIKDIAQRPSPRDRKEAVLRELDILDLVNAAVAKVRDPWTAFKQQP